MGSARRSRSRHWAAVVLGTGLLCSVAAGTAARAADPEPTLRASIRLDHRTYVRGEDVTGVTTFTNPTAHDVLVTDKNGCLHKWGVVAARGDEKFEMGTTLECRSATAFPRPRNDYLAFHPGVTRIAFALSSMGNICTGDPASVRTGIPACDPDGGLPAFPVGPARVGLVVAGPAPAVQKAPARRIRIVPLGHRPPFCSAPHLRVAERAVHVRGASTVVEYTAVNTSTVPCRFDGVPMLSFSGPSGSDSSFDHLRLRAAHPVRVGPGATASFTATFATRPGCTHPITTTHVVLPDRGGVVELPTQANPCAYADDIARVTVSPWVGRTAVHD